MTRLLLIADTHLPKRAKQLPQQVWDEVDRADIVVHAGDWVQVSLLDELEDRAQRVVGVYGNNDGDDLRSRLPEVARFEVDRRRFAVVHETGPATNREKRCVAEYPDVDVLIFGHSHIPWDTTAAGGLRLLNPGSPTDRRRQPYCTYMTVEVDEGLEVTLHQLEKAGPPQK